MATYKLTLRSFRWNGCGVRDLKSELLARGWWDDPCTKTFSKENARKLAELVVERAKQDELNLEQNPNAEEIMQCILTETESHIAELNAIAAMDGGVSWTCHKQETTTSGCSFPCHDKVIDGNTYCYSFGFTVMGN